MANNPKAVDNLVIVPKGQSGNPAGRPRGIVDRRQLQRVVQEIFQWDVIVPEELEAQIRKWFPRAVNPEDKKLNALQLMTIQMFFKAVVKRDVRAFQALIDAGFDRAAQPIELPQLNKNVSEMTDDELLQAATQFNLISGNVTEGDVTS